MIKRKYVVLLLLTLVSIPLTALFYSNLVQAQSTAKGYISLSPTMFVGCGISYDPNWAPPPTKPYLDAVRDLYYAMVQFPHGVTLTNMTFNLYDELAAHSVSVELLGFNLTSGQHLSFPMAKVSTGHAFMAGDITVSNDTISDAKIDNENCIYTIRVYFTTTGSSLQYFWGMIEYEYETASVGGFYIPIDKLGLLAPYIALVSIIILAVSITVAHIKIRKKQ